MRVRYGGSGFRIPLRAIEDDKVVMIEAGQPLASPSPAVAISEILCS